MKIVLINGTEIKASLIQCPTKAIVTLDVETIACMGLVLSNVEA